MENKEWILNQVRIKYNKSLSEQENLQVLRNNHDELIISPDECYLAMEYYAEQKLNIHSVMQAEGADVSEGAAVGNSAAGQSGSDGLCYKSGEPCKYGCAGLCKESC